MNSRAIYGSSLSSPSRRGGCDDPSVVPDPLPPGIIMMSGDNQSAKAGEPLAEHFLVLVRRATRGGDRRKGEALLAILVTWHVAS